MNQPSERAKTEQQPSCQNCGKGTCMFHGEDRKPVYGMACWLSVADAQAEKCLN